MEQDRITDKEFLIFIQFLIKKSIYTQAEIAKKLNITPPSLSRQLSGKDPLPVARLIALMEHLQFSPQLPPKFGEYANQTVVNSLQNPYAFPWSEEKRKKTETWLCSCDKQDSEDNIQILIEKANKHDPDEELYKIIMRTLTDHALEGKNNLLFAAISMWFRMSEKQRVETICYMSDLLSGDVNYNEH